MFCDRCGSTLSPGAQFCNACGKQVLPSPGAGAGPAVAGNAGPQGAVAQDRVRRNIQLLTVLWLAYGILRLLEVFWLITFGRLILPGIFGRLGGSGWPMMHSGWNWFVPFGLFGAGMYAGVFGVAYLILAWALHERRPWARMYGLVLGFLALLQIPMGTALGIYTIWVLLPESSRAEYEQLPRA